MASSAQIKSLLASHSTGDHGRFYAVALQIAAAEARQGHEVLAREIREMVDRAKARSVLPKSGATIIHVTQPQGEAAELLEPFVSDIAIADLVLPRILMARIRRILSEQQNTNRLREHGLKPRQRLLFTGPPGCGKTMTASALASELALPLFVVRLDSLITRYLGDSLIKLRLVFDAVNQSRAVYLFDEFDSIGYQRDAGADVGEMRRLLNAFLMFMERLTSTSVVIAATNHGERLDRALFRRFDDILEFSLPTDDEICAAFLARLAGVKTSKFDFGPLLEAARGLSYADISRSCSDATKEMLLHSKKQVTSEMLQRALAERRVFQSA